MSQTTPPDVPSLCAAAEVGDLAAVRRILEAAPELATQDTAGNDEHQALHYAVFGDQPDVVRVLLEAGADPLNGVYPHRGATSPRTLADDRGLTAIIDVIDAWLAETRGATDAGQDLADAVGRGDGDAVRALLDRDADLIGARDRRGRTALHGATQRADLDLARELLDRGADVDPEDSGGHRPLHEALLHSWKVPDAEYSRYTALAGFLIGRGARYDLWAAAGVGDLTGVRSRLGEGDGAWKAGGESNPVVVAAFRGHAEVLRELLAAGADPDTPSTIDVAGDTVEQWGRPLWLASNRGHLDVVDVLLAGGARPEVAVYASGSAVEQSLLHGHRRLADRLLLHGASGDLLTYCVTGDVAAIAERLRAHPEDRGRLLWSALLAGNEVVLENELARGASVSSGDQFDLLQQAIRGWRLGDLKIGNEGWDRRSYTRNLQRLLDAGFDPQLRASRSPRADFTILHHLAARACNASSGHTTDEVVEFARILVDGGAEVDALEKQLQSTPLGWAARYGQRELCAFLLQRGADIDRGGADWARPLAWADRYGHGEVAALLREAGAR